MPYWQIVFSHYLGNNWHKQSYSMAISAYMTHLKWLLSMFLCFGKIQNGCHGSPYWKIIFSHNLGNNWHKQSYSMAISANVTHLKWLLSTFVCFGKIQKGCNGRPYWKSYLTPEPDDNGHKKSYNMTISVNLKHLKWIMSKFVFQWKNKMAAMASHGQPYWKLPGTFSGYSLI